jgi:LysM repeat protein
MRSLSLFNRKLIFHITYNLSAGNPMENLSKANKTPVQDPGSPASFKQRFTLSTLELLFGSLILIGILYMGYFILFRDGSGSNSQFEKRIKSLESYYNEQDTKTDKKLKTVQDGLVQLESRLKKLEALEIQTENTNKELLARISKMQKQFGEVKKPVTPQVKEKIEYKVKKGETLQSIAKKFKVSREDLARWNKMDKNKPLLTGEVLIIVSH